MRVGTPWFTVLDVVSLSQVRFAIFPVDKNIDEEFVSNFALQMKFRVRNR